MHAKQPARSIPDPRSIHSAISSHAPIDINMRNNRRRRECASPLPMAITAIAIVAMSIAVAPIFPSIATSTHHRYFSGIVAQAASITDEEATLIAEGERMADQYTEQIEIIVQLLDDPLDQSANADNSNNDNTATTARIIDKGQKAFDAALLAFPDDTLPHAHALFAKLCVKMGRYEQSLELFDEAIRRASLPLNASNETDTSTTTYADDQLYDQDTIAEAEMLTKQLVLERNRSHFLYLQSQINSWDQANHVYYKGGIPPETSPLDPLRIAQHQVKIFPNPHPQTLFNIATFSVLLLDSPEDWEGVDGRNDDVMNATKNAWEAHKTYGRAQTWSFGSYIHGKKRNLAGGQTCQGEDHGFGVLVGGSAWSEAASESVPFDSSNDDTSNFMGTVTLENIILSGRDAVPSGYGSDCHIYVPHRYVNLANNIPMVTSWETPVQELTIGDSSSWSTYIPEDNVGAYGGKIGKDPYNNDVLMIPDPRKSGRRSNGFDSAVLLAGYAADNYYHFVAEVLPSLVMMKDSIQAILSSGNTKDVIIVQNLHQDFAEGFFRLMLPEAITEEDGKFSKKIVNWGPDKHPISTKIKNNGISKFASPHPITFVRQMYTAVWDQPDQAPPPMGGPAHCLTPAPLLRNMQLAVWDAAGIVNESSKLKIVYCSRSSSSTRKLKDEKKLLSRLADVASTMNAELEIFEKKGTDNSTTVSPLQFVTDTVKLFASADVVVGVHGASLANIAFSQAGTTIVEMGFEALPQASHYRHLSLSLGLNHMDIFLTKDSRSLGATEVQLRLGGLNEVVGAVVEGLERAMIRRTEGKHMEL